MVVAVVLDDDDEEEEDEDGPGPLLEAGHKNALAFTTSCHRMLVNRYMHIIVFIDTVEYCMIK